MYIKMELNSLDGFNAWSGGLDTLNDIREANKINELDLLFEDVFAGETPTDTEVNDWLWFDRDYIYESLDMTDDETGKQVEDIEND